MEEEINTSVVHILKSMRYNKNQPKQQKRKLQVPAGKSVAIDDFESSDESSQHFRTHDSNSDMDPMSDFEEQIDENSGAGKEELSLPISNESKISNNSHQVSISNSLLPVTNRDINVGDWLLIHLPYFTNDRAQSTFKAFSRYYIAQVVKLNEDGYVGNFLREKTTRDYSGYVYTFPNVKDEYEFTFQQITGKINPPEKYGRGLLSFQIRLYEYNKQFK
ncbi:hypothetical protein RN001_016237 [Aquatica leii]|uniref:Uncharacterized protein n=1 Tax=Aquatica leii TaxID=1421715 RepID=A0AAN7SKC3_9COLE|nr:hypothetical protein RN001_016237 [Aquatica leii]